MKIFNYLFLLMACAMITFTACEKEIYTSDVDEVEVVPTVTDQNGLLTHVGSRNETIVLGCLTIDMPFEMEMLDGSTVTINTETDLTDLFENATEENYPVDFVYPLYGTDEDGNSLVLNNPDELGAAFVECIPDEGWGGEEFPEDFFPAWEISMENSCYDLVYPLTLVDIEDNEVSIADVDELIATLSDGNLYSFSFPISLTDEDGNASTANDGEELFELLSDCFDDPGSGPGPGGFGIDGFFGCYELSYPATLIDEDGNAIVVNNDDEFANVFLTAGCFGFEYPLTLIDEEGNEFTVNSDDELWTAIFECDEFGGGGPFPPTGEEPGEICFELEYPYTMVDLITGDEYVIESEEDLAIINAPLDFVYPFTITYVESSESVDINSPEEFGEALQDCF